MPVIPPPVPPASTGAPVDTSPGIVAPLEASGGADGAPVLAPAPGDSVDGSVPTTQAGNVNASASLLPRPSVLTPEGPLASLDRPPQEPAQVQPVENQLGVTQAVKTPEAPEAPQQHQPEASRPSHAPASVPSQARVPDSDNASRTVPPLNDLLPHDTDRQQEVAPTNMGSEEIPAVPGEPRLDVDADALSAAPAAPAAPANQVGEVGATNAYDGVDSATARDSVIPSEGGRGTSSPDLNGKKEGFVAGVPLLGLIGLLGILVGLGIGLLLFSPSSANPGSQPIPQPTTLPASTQQPATTNEGQGGDDNPTGPASPTPVASPTPTADLQASRWHQGGALRGVLLI